MKFRSDNISAAFKRAITIKARQPLLRLTIHPLRFKLLFDRGMHGVQQSEKIESIYSFINKDE
jgi:hypothetical protein